MTTVLGLDIGGTRTRARLVRDGSVLAEVEGGSASLTAAGRQQAGTALTAILDQLGLRQASLDAICAGSAGSGSGDAHAFLTARLAPLARHGTVIVVNDVALVLPAADVGDGIAVVAGTGSNCIGRHAGRERAAGGWGWLLGDQGSGYWIVKQAVRQVLRRHDEQAPPGPLTRELLHRVGCQDPRALLQRFYDEGTSDDARRAADFHRGHGSTTMLASLVTAPVEELQARSDMLAGLAAGGVIADIHLEGPFLSAARRGAQDPRHMLAPDVAVFERVHAAASWPHAGCCG